MENLIQYTGGSIYMTIALIVVTAIAEALALVNFFISLKKNTGLNKSRKIEYAVCIIGVFWGMFVIGALIGYYYGVLKFL